MLFKNYYYLVLVMQSTQKTEVSIINALRSKGYKATPQRIAICKIALGSPEHPSVQKIYTDVKKTKPTVSLATVYSTLNILKDSGLIQELNFPKGQTRYDPYIEPHINLICLRCGKIQDLDDQASKELVKKVTGKVQFTPSGQRIDIYGTCEHCAKHKLAKKPSKT
jgi:Fur family peroxide stress response transcriptional regulator